MSASLAATTCSLHLSSSAISQKLSGVLYHVHTCVPSTDEEPDEDGIERTCDTLLMCIVTVLNQGLRNGGGVGDVLRKPSKDVSILYDVASCSCMLDR